MLDVRDVAVSREFYGEKLGLTPCGGSDDFAFFDAGGTMIVLSAVLAREAADRTGVTLRRLRTCGEGKRRPLPGVAIFIALGFQAVFDDIVLVFRAATGRAARTVVEGSSVAAQATPEQMVHNQP